MIYHELQQPNHFGHRLRGQILQWSGLDSEYRYQHNLRDNRDRLRDLGYLYPTSVNYRYNSHGFRSGEFIDGNCVMALGGSMTEGVGIPEQYTWCSVLSTMLRIPVWNMGIGACAMDTCFRVLDHYLPILCPSAVILLKPPPARFELFAHYGTWDVYGPHMTVDRHEGFIKEYLLSDDNSQVNERKNYLAMAKLCDDAALSFFCYETEDINIDGAARDLMHPGKDAHQKFAEKVYDHMEKSSWKSKNQP